MHLFKTVRLGLATLLVAGACAAMTPGAKAQGGGGFQMTPEMQAKIKAWQKWRESHKNISTLQTMLYQVREVDKDPTTQLDKKQAGKMLSIMKTWRNKPTMTDDQAKEVSKQVGAILNEKQLKKMSTIQTPWQRRGGGGGGGGGRPPGGGGGGGGARPAGGSGGFKFPDPPAGGYNPINPDTLPFEQMRPQAKASIDGFMADLSKQAK